MTRPRLPAAYFVPIALLALAIIGLGISCWPRPDERAAALPVSLSKDAVYTVDFRPGHDGRYDIGIEMDQGDAKRLMPCQADPQYGKACDTPSPIVISLSLRADDVDISSQLRLSTASAGGHYGGTSTYTYDLASVYLVRDLDYQLQVRSQADGSLLAPAHPRLVVERDRLEQKDETLSRLLLFLASAAVGLLGLLGIAAVAIYRWFRREF